MTTRSDIRTMVRLRLGDLGDPPVLSDTQLNQWINDAHREYSLHFPRLAEVHIPCLAGIREYTLDGRTDESSLTVDGARFVLRVEYPYNLTTPQILVKRSEFDRRGFYGEKVYDLRDSPEKTLLLGLSPAGTETIALQVACDHPSLEQDSSETTLPDQHLELVVLFVRWLALQELATTEATDPSPTGVILSGLSSALARAWEEYTAMLSEALRISTPGSGTVQWEGGV